MARSTQSRSLVSRFLIGAAALALALGTYKLGTAVLGDDDSLSIQHLANQVWIERLPRDDRDMINHMVLVEDGRERFGAFGKSSQWRHFVEIFRWSREEHRLTLMLPQDRKRLDLGVRVWDCEDEAPAPFQLCLELSNDKRKIRYYSRHDWTLDSLEQHPELSTIDAPAPVPAFAADDFEAAEDLVVADGE